MKKLAVRFPGFFLFFSLAATFVHDLSAQDMGSAVVDTRVRKIITCTNDKINVDVKEGTAAYDLSIKSTNGSISTQSGEISADREFDKPGSASLTLALNVDRDASAIVTLVPDAMSSATMTKTLISSLNEAVIDVTDVKGGVSYELWYSTATKDRNGDVIVSDFVKDSKQSGTASDRNLENDIVLRKPDTADMDVHEIKVVIRAANDSNAIVSFREAEK